MYIMKRVWMFIGNTVHNSQKETIQISIIRKNKYINKIHTPQYNSHENEQNAAT